MNEFLQANLKTRVNYFSVINQNNQMNCLLHFHPCFTFDFLHSAVMISYQNSPSQWWISSGVVYFENQPPSCFHFNAKIILCLYYRHNNVTKVELYYQENHTFYLFAGLTWTWKLYSDFYDFIKFSAKRQLLLLLLPATSATMTSKRSKWNNLLGEL